VRVVFDSNVIISAFLFGGLPARLLALAMGNQIQAYTSLAILDEVRDVLQRPKFGLTAADALMLVEELRQLCEVIDPVSRVQKILQDTDDHMILECALTARAHLIVTGDAQLLALRKWRKIEILNPADTLARLSKRPAR